MHGLKIEIPLKHLKNQWLKALFFCEGKVFCSSLIVIVDFMDSLFCGWNQPLCRMLIYNLSCRFIFINMNVFLSFFPIQKKAMNQGLPAMAIVPPPTYFCLLPFSCLDYLWFKWRVVQFWAEQYHALGSMWASFQINQGSDLSKI